MVTTRDAAQEIARLLLGTGEAPIEHGGATATFEAITDGPIARITALVVTSRVPEPARSALGIAPCGHLLNTQQEAKGHTPLGHALRGLSISREQLGATVTLAHQDDADSEIAVLSSARLWLPSGWPLALVTERVYAQFLGVYPPPWPPRADAILSP